MFAELSTLLGTAGWAIIATTAACLYRRRLHTDPLTGLGNRQALHRTARRERFTRSLVGLLMVDLDQFKAINDTHGHDFGNKVLAAVATQLATATKPGELAVRLHGDEFALWLGPIPTTTAAEQRAESVAAALAEPIRVDGHRLTVLGSVGLATAPASTPLAELLGHADAHMYQVKATHRLTVLPTGQAQRTRDQHTPGGEAA
ncbi:diguanylate cyclase (GGDEF)-like protein [Halopolyspora algeriensis]|uniref:Diguanylate cyclase (GGDEF)-like protein n=1 Tax=Halopolyspora algeriensis TaxID=1500506 RepID=A0A368VZP1_9ACTN|nr:GGDEF domain-containing protein [Halopolyspora algeriensis]RCW46842.1 diguanylate cyclase (GGDEF)-like protein [Halopolyspora algeriensis]TQM47933.1 diguanylate cyclase (GGDEF)-like protein [Halopolyspora algeriensis]